MRYVIATYQICQNLKKLGYHQTALSQRQHNFRFLLFWVLPFEYPSLRYIFVRESLSCVNPPFSDNAKLVREPNAVRFAKRRGIVHPWNGIVAIKQGMFPGRMVQFSRCLCFRAPGRERTSTDNIALLPLMDQITAKARFVCWVFQRTGNIFFISNFTKYVEN